MHIPRVLLPPWRGRGAVKLAPLCRRSRGERFGWGGRTRRVSSVPYAALSPPPLPSPIKGEGIEEAKSLLEIA